MMVLVIMVVHGVDITCDGGSYQSEVAWSITDCDGNLIVSGGAPHSTVCNDLPADYVVVLSDSWGDGWNGNVLTIDGTSYTLDFTNDDGSSASFGVGACFVEVLGCMDEAACNYNALANTDDGSCTYPYAG